MSGELLPGAANFIVEEEAAYLPTGSGEHLYLRIEKEGLTTDAVADALAKCAGIKSFSVGYAGRKDRHAITRQWFSLHTPKDIDAVALAALLPAGRISVLEASRHKNKLRLGHLAGNRFDLGLSGISEPALRGVLADITRDGLRNRFGPQRFGLGGATLRLAAALAAGDADAAVATVVAPLGTWKPGDDLPYRRGGGPEVKIIGALRRGVSSAEALRAGGEALRQLAASAAQSAVFNAILDARVAAGLLHTLRAGDIACVTAKGACFKVTPEELAEVNQRAAPGTLDVSTTAPLPGGELRLHPDVPFAEEERAWAASTGVDWAWFDRGKPLASPGERRPLVVPLRGAPELTAQADGTWRLRLDLRPGSYATEVLLQAGITIPSDRRG
jgi:tRNA pseudouridine13 synthase